MLCQFGNKIGFKILAGPSRNIVHNDRNIEIRQFCIMLD